MTLLRIRDGITEWPYSRAQLQADHPHLSLSWELPEHELRTLEELGIYVYRAVTTEPPSQDGCQAVEVSPECENGVWRQAWELQPIPPAPSRPDWLTFKAAVLRSATVNQALAAAWQLAPVAAAALAPSLAMAERGSPDEFAVVWGAIIQATAVPAPELVGLAALAEACNLPQAFVEAINPPTGMVRARDEVGRFIADDPATPENEAWEPAE